MSFQRTLSALALALIAATAFGADTPKKLDLSLPESVKEAPAHDAAADASAIQSKGNCDALIKERNDLARKNPIDKNTGTITLNGRKKRKAELDQLILDQKCWKDGKDPAAQ